MNSRQEAKLTMYRTVEQHCNSNTAVISNVNAFMTAFEAFKLRVAAIINLEQQAETNIVGIATGKTNLRRDLTQKTADLAKPIYAFAAVTGNEILKKEVDLPVSVLRRTRDEQLAPLCRIIHERAVEHADALRDYGVIPEKTAELQTLIEAYARETPKPRTAMSNRKTLKSNLAANFREADRILKEQMDKLVVSFKTAAPDFVQTYQTARNIIDPSHTATQIKGTVVNSADNAPLKGATVTVIELNQTAQTDALGKYLFKPVPHGRYTLRFTMPNFIPREIADVEVKLGDIRSLDVGMSNS